VQHQSLNEHQANEGLAETDTVAKKRPTVLPRDLHQRPVRLLLVTVDPGEHPRASFVPLGCGQLVSAEELLERFRVNIERRVGAGMALNKPEDVVRHILRVIPVVFEPLLQLGDFAAALHLDVELYVLREARTGEVA
jgi:hypothetical protein